MADGFPPPSSRGQALRGNDGGGWVPASVCLVPRTTLKSIGLQPLGKRTYELADGSEIRFDITVARVEFMGEFVGATILFGEDDAEPLLGVTALEPVGIEVDPLNQTLKRLPAVRLKGFRHRHVTS